MGKCPICGEPRAPFGENRFFPFCCRRCKLADLARWLGEEYSVPVAEPETWSEDDSLSD